MATPLLGPPFVRGARPPPDIGFSSHPFLDLLDAGFNNPAPEAVGDRRIEALGPDPCLDFYFQVVPGTPTQRVRDLLAAAWAHDNLTALKLVCNLRGVRGTGKGDMEGFYAAALWIHDNHPKTLACNIPVLAQFGYLKDFPELLFRIVSDTRKTSVKAVAPAAASSGRKRRRNASPQLSDAAAATSGKKVSGKTPHLSPQLSDAAAATSRKKLTGKTLRRAAQAVKALDRYHLDGRYRSLFDNTAQFFADLLLSDIENKKLNRPSKIGLAAKWCPTPGLSFDRSTLLCEGIARRMFPQNSKAEYADMLEEDYCYHVLSRLRREVLVPLRQLLQLPEVYMTANRWSDLPYDHVASVAMHRYKALFKRHDRERFERFATRKVAGKGETLLPHKIASLCNHGEVSESELQWYIMMVDLHDKGFARKLTNCICVCDVSDGMEGTPMEVSTALTVLISDLSEEPWTHKVMAFSQNPSIQTIQGRTLQEKLNFLQNMKVDVSTNFKEVYDVILDTAKNLQLPNEKMIKTIFVFSNKEFNAASYNLWYVDYPTVCRDFRNAGYGDVVPQIVFWNLQGSRAATVTQQGVMRLKGFSMSLMKIFLENGGIVHGKNEMLSVLSGKEYEELAVFD